MNLPASLADRLRSDCDDLAAIHDEGRHSDAWATADELATFHLEGLDERFLDPDYNAPPEDDLTGLGPAELAALVPPRYSRR